MRSFACLLLLALLAITFLPETNAQGDGNPHNWDRKRRCDQIDYDPPCGPCEGYGGIPTGDKNDEITLTTCSVVANASSVDPKTLIKPVWTEKFVTRNYSEVLIGPKVDPFCFQVAPSNTSAGPLCYQKDGGMQNYDMSPTGPGVLRDDLILDSSVGKIESRVTAQGLVLWILNKFPWYAAGTHQCICTNVHQGSDAKAAFLYPIQYNWTQQMYFVGREKIGIEYMNTEMVLDHWAYGPHHVWSVPETGKTVRMWQPYNGLEVFPEGTQNSEEVDPKLFEDIPPALCKKGGATFRIGCDDNGQPIPKGQEEATAAAKLAQITKQANENDHARAKQIVPRDEYRGDSFSNMSHTLNKWLASSAKVKMCDKFSAKELQKLAATLFLARDVDLDKVYSAAYDNRRLLGDLSKLQKDWDSLNAEVEAHPDQEFYHEVQRDGHCHEVVMWYVHHLSEDVKKVLGESGVEIPLLAYNNHRVGCAVAKDDTHSNVCKAYESQVLCSDCHSNVRPTK